MDWTIVDEFERKFAETVQRRRRGDYSDVFEKMFSDEEKDKEEEDEEKHYTSEFSYKYEYNDILKEKIKAIEADQELTLQEKTSILVHYFVCELLYRSPLERLELCFQAAYKADTEKHYRLDSYLALKSYYEGDEKKIQELLPIMKDSPMKIIVSGLVSKTPYETIKKDIFEYSAIAGVLFTEGDILRRDIKDQYIFTLNEAVFDVDIYYEAGIDLLIFDALNDVYFLKKNGKEKSIEMMKFMCAGKGMLLSEMEPIQQKILYDMGVLDEEEPDRASVYKTEEDVVDYLYEYCKSDMRNRFKKSELKEAFSEGLKRKFYSFLGNGRFCSMIGGEILRVWYDRLSYEKKLNGLVKEGKDACFRMTFSLKYPKGVITRTLYVPVDSMLSDVAYFFLHSIGADPNYHLTEVATRGTRYVLNEHDDDSWEMMYDHRERRLCRDVKVYEMDSSSFTITYDFGENWEFSGKLSDRLYEQNSGLGIQVRSGKGYSIFEDDICGFEDYFETKEIDEYNKHNLMNLDGSIMKYEEFFGKLTSSMLGRMNYYYRR